MTDDLQAPRTIPDALFGTTTHVNSEGLIRWLEDLRISNVRLGFYWNRVEPSMLEYLRAKSDGHRIYAVTEEGQARALARAYLVAATVPWIEPVYFFHLHQEASYTQGDRAAFSEHESLGGLLKHYERRAA